MNRTSMFRTSPIDPSPSNSGFQGRASMLNLRKWMTFMTSYFGEVDKSNINKLNESVTIAQATLFANDCALFKKQVEANEAQIAAYQNQFKNLDTPPSAFAITAGVPSAGPDVTPSTVNDPQ